MVPTEPTLARSPLLEHANSETIPQHGPTGMAVAPKPRSLPGNKPTAPTVGPPSCLQQATLPRPAVTRPPTRRQTRQFPGIDPTKVPPGSSDGPARLRRVRAKGRFPRPTPTRHPSLTLLLGFRGVRIAGHSSPEEDLDAHNEHAASASADARPSTKATPSPSGTLPHAWTSSSRDHEGGRPESLYSVDGERDDSFTSVLDSIRRVNNLEKPAGVTPSWGKTTFALKRGLQSEPSPVLHLPPSELLKALVGDVN